MFTFDTETDRFRVKIHGNSMAPRWKTDDRIEFSTWRAATPPIGDDCYIERSDGKATFKTLVRANETEYVLKARNKRYPKEISVLKADVVRLAVAEGVVIARPK
jgi:phage repressor protein C with HTH and peptisase S24 domain